MRKLTRAVIGLALVIYCTASAADPNGVARQLMSQQVSMMDFGLDRIERAMPIELPFTSADNDNLSLNFSANFDWDASQIILQSSLYTQTVGPKAHRHDVATLKAICKEGVNLIRYFLGIDRSMGNPIANAATVAHYLRPKSFSFKSESPEFEPGVFAMTRIRVTETAINGSMQVVALVKCEAPYLGTDVLFPG